MADVNTNVFMNVCVPRKKKRKMARENGIKQKRRGLERTQRGQGGGGGAGRVMGVIPGKETLERCRGSL